VLLHSDDDGVHLAGYGWAFCLSISVLAYSTPTYLADGALARNRRAYSPGVTPNTRTNDRRMESELPNPARIATSLGTCVCRFQQRALPPPRESVSTNRAGSDFFFGRKHSREVTRAHPALTCKQLHTQILMQGVLLSIPATLQ